MKLFTLLAGLLLAGSLFSQDYENEIPYTFGTGETFYLLADSVNVRKTPELKGKLVTQLPIGTPVKILSQSREITELNNVRMYWYEVQFGGSKKGYVWGGKIAKTSFRSSSDHDLVFHFGIDRAQRPGWHGEDELAVYQIRSERNGKQQERIELDGFGYTMKSHTLTNYGNKGLQPIDDIFYFEGQAEACGDEAGAIVLFLVEGKMKQVKRLAYYADVPVFSYDYLYFPSDMEGKKDRIVFRHESGEWVESDDPSDPGYTRYDEQETTVYKWDGEKLVPAR
jgi:hypothetical protein